MKDSPIGRGEGGGGRGMLRDLREWLACLGPNPKGEPPLTP